MTEIAVSMREWQKLRPESGTPLFGVDLDIDKATRDTVEMLAKSRRLEILGLTKGISIQSFSYIGSVKIGNIRISIKPKLKGSPLLRLLSYAYHMRRSHLFSSLRYETEVGAFQDLLIEQLRSQANELISRGLHRHYVRREEDLSSVRGRIDFQRFTRQVGVAEATLPCVHSPRIEDSLINQVLLAGIKLGVRLTENLMLRTRLRRTAAQMKETISEISLNRNVLKAVNRGMNRLTAAYESAIRIIEILMESIGISMEHMKPELFRVPGFLFDMNRFYQALVLRFLRENLVGYEVQDEYGLRDMISYMPGYHRPDKRKDLSPRPDYVVLDRGQIVSILDAKYRNLWQTEFPTKMLYQLCIYALSQKENRHATIIYPVIDEDEAKEERLEIRDPLHGHAPAQVNLRPLNLMQLDRLLSAPDTRQNERERNALAYSLVFGDQ